MCILEVVPERRVSDSFIEVLDSISCQKSGFFQYKTPLILILRIVVESSFRIFMIIIS